MHSLTVTVTKSGPYVAVGKCGGVGCGWSHETTAFRNPADAATVAARFFDAHRRMCGSLSATIDVTAPAAL